jgi:chloride channel protein, CIC family
LKINLGKFASRILPGVTGRLGELIRKWVPLAVTVGVITGLLTIVLDEGINVLLLGSSPGGGGFTGYTMRLYEASPLAAFFLPFAGLVITGLLLRKYTTEPYLSGTEEVVNHYHGERGLGLRDGAVKFLASFFTIGLGGSSGLEGPSTNAGAVVGSWVWRRFSSRLTLTKEDLRIMLLVGASAGVAAIFKTPLTGIFFALEVPYRDHLASKAFLPSMIAGVSSYVTLASFEGISPLFSFAQASATFTLYDLAFASLFGLIIGIIAVLFSSVFHAASAFMKNVRIPFMARFALGGVGLGLIALVFRLYYDTPYTLGPGYQVIQGALSGTFSIQLLLAILVLRMLATTLTLGTGGMGGMFFPMVLFGALIGSAFGLVLHVNIAVSVSVGIAAFMSAGYKTPISAVTFVAESTGSVTYLIPAMVGSVIAYITSGTSSVSTEQKDRTFDTNL